MPLFLPDGLPAAQTLREEGFDIRLASEDSAPRALQVALVNLMPGKQDTELAFARLLAQTGRAVALTLLVPGSYRSTTAPPDHLARFYRRWPEMSGRSFDGLIVTGAPVETLPFEEVSYWPEFREMVHWARSHVRQSLYICWSAQAALFVLRQVPKTLLLEKAFGVFEQQLTTASIATKGMGTGFPVPVSRHSESNRAALAACGAKVLAGSSETGASLVEDPDNRAHFFFDHLEYASDALLREYERDRAKGLAIALPRPPMRDQGWEPYAALFYRNWLDIIHPAGEAATASSVGWLFSVDTHRDAGEGEILIEASARPHILSEILACLAVIGIDPSFAKILMETSGAARVGLRFDTLRPDRMEEAARALLGLSGTRDVFIRLSDGSGGAFHRTRSASPLAHAA